MLTRPYRKALLAATLLTFVTQPVTIARQAAEQ